MNETYIKRQITLLNLGIPMSDDIQKYYDDFNILFESLGKLEREIESEEVITWSKSKGYKNVIIYDYIEYEFWITPFFKDYFNVKYGLVNYEIEMMLNLFLENIFNLEVKICEKEEENLDWI